MNIIAIVQARMRSTRLPGKVLKRINNRYVLDFVIDRLRGTKYLNEIILATTTNKKDDVLEKYALEKKINFFRGSEEDVLDRYYKAAKKFHADIIVRITSDCPLIDPIIVDSIIKYHIKKKSDYTSNTIKRTFPRGLDVEVFNFKTLENAFFNAKQKYQREHVTPYIWENKDKFILHNFEADYKIKRPDIRITIDTDEDLKLICQIIIKLNKINFTAEEVINLLEKNPEILKINKHIKQKNLKIPKNIAFRVNASKRIGIGHLMRCIALAEEIIKRGYKCHFISYIEGEELKEKVKNKNIELLEIKETKDLEQDVNYLIDFCIDHKIEWIVTDIYDIKSDYLKALKKRGFRVLSIDDNALFHYYSDIVVNQNIGSEKLNIKAENYTNILRGTKYVILRDDLIVTRNSFNKNVIENILITLGGTDHQNYTLDILKKITDIKINKIAIIGVLNQHYKKIKEYVKNKQDIIVINSPEKMSEIYKKADIAISAGGTTCYELAYYGIPNLILTVADNQLNIARELDKKNVSINLGRKEDLSHIKLKENLIELINNKDIRNKMKKEGMRLIDGKGKIRIVDTMNL